MDQYFNEGYEAANSIIGQEDVAISFPAEDEDVANAIRFVDGVIQRFHDRLQAVKGIRASMNFLKAVQAYPEYDAVHETYKGVRLAHATSFWPHGKVEIVAGARVNNGDDGKQS